jgi:hypothetical protein
MHHCTSRNILLLLTKTWNTYSPGRCGSYLPQVHPMGIRTTLCHTYSAIFENCTEKGLEQRMVKGGRKEVRSSRRSSPYMTESTEIDCRQKLKDVGIEDEDKESMEKGRMSDI